MIEGGLPNRAQKMVNKWAKKYQDDLLELSETQKFKILPGRVFAF